MISGVPRHFKRGADVSESVNRHWAAIARSLGHPNRFPMLTPATLEIGFSLLSTQGDEHLFKGPSDATAMDLRYDFFLGDLWLRVDGVELDARWGWVPLLDAATAFSLIVDGLVGGKAHLAFDFTESGDEILFDCDHQSGRVCISSNFAESRLYTTLADLREAVRSFGERVITQAIEREPSLKDNKTLEQWYPTYTQRRLELD